MTGGKAPVGRVIQAMLQRNIILIAALTLGAASCAPRYSGLPPVAAPASSGSAQTGDVLGMTLAWVDTGGSGPPVVLLHGLSSSLGFWRYQIDGLSAQGYRVLALDLPGFGASDRPDAPYTPPWYATVVDAWLEQLGVSQAVVLGHSMGGQIALTLALNHPSRVSRLVLSAPAGIERFTPGEARWMKTYWTEGRALQADEEAIRANFHATFNRIDPDVERLLEERVRMATSPSFQGTSVAVSRCVAGMLDHPVADRLGQIAVPTLILFGSDDRLIPNPIFHGGRTAAVGEAGEAAIPGAELVLIPGAGHAVHHDAPEAFNAAVLRALGGA